MEWLCSLGLRGRNLSKTRQSMHQRFFAAGRPAVLGLDASLPGLVGLEGLKIDLKLGLKPRASSGAAPG